MKLKNYFVVMLLFMLLICCVGAISAATDDNMDGDTLTIDQSEDTVSVSDLEEVSQADVSDDDSLAASQEEVTLEKTNDDQLGDTAAAEELTPYEQFAQDLKGDAKTVYLTGNIKISKPFEIHRNVVIDGQGHTIDAQHKTNIFKIYGTVTLKNLVLKNGKAKLGGAVYSNGKLTVSKCTFKNNRATQYGGAIVNIHGSLKVYNSVFQKNSVDSSGKAGYGGAIWIYASSSKISKSTFKSNKCNAKKLKKHSKATKYKFNGGAIAYSQGSSHTITSCVFEGNQASNHGGSLFIFKSKSLTIKKSTFKKNKARFEDGGAVSFSGKKLIIRDSNFNNNLAYEDGGAIDSYSLTSSKIGVSIKNTKFTSNTAYKGAGAIWMGVKTSYSMEKNKFTKNKASLGGALVAESGSGKIVSCNFISNKAAKVTSWTVKTKSGGVLNHCGGAIFIEKYNLKVTKSTFKKNKATYGGAAQYNAGKVSFKKCKFSGNKASKYGNNIFKNN